VTKRVSYLLVPGGGGSGPEHWHHRWANDLPNCDWVHQEDPSGGTCESWVATIDAAIRAQGEPVVLVAHSLATIAVAHWARSHSAPVLAALLVAPADVEAPWAEPDSVYKRFAPIPLAPLPFPTTVVASTNDPFLSTERAEQFAQSWNSDLAVIGDHLHIGSDALLDRWTEGRQLLSELVDRVNG